MEETQLVYDLLNVRNISQSSMGRIKEPNGPHIDPGPLFARACCWGKDSTSAGSATDQLISAGFNCCMSARWSRLPLLLRCYADAFFLLKGGIVCVANRMTRCCAPGSHERIAAATGGAATAHENRGREVVSRSLIKCLPSGLLKTSLYASARMLLLQCGHVWADGTLSTNLGPPSPTARPRRSSCRPR